MRAMEPLTPSLRRHLVAKQDWLIGGALFVFALLVFLSFRPWDLAALGDIAIFQLFGRLIADGAVPYRDFFDHKTPLVGYVNAVPAIGSNLFGSDYVISTRIVSMVVAASASVGLYMLGRAASLSRIASIAAAGTYVAFNFASFLVAFGIDAKALVSYLGIFGLLAAYRSRWVASGALCGLSALAWQPGAVFLAGAATCALVRRDSGRTKNLALLGTGFFAPFFLLILYFALTGALDEFWQDAFVFNRQYVDRQFTLLPRLGEVAEVIDRGYSSERWVFLLASFGATLWLVLAVGGLWQKHLSAAVTRSAPIAVVTLAVLVYSYVNFTSEVDVLPFLPWVAFWTAFLLDRVSRPMRSAAPMLAIAGTAALFIYGHQGLTDRLPLLTSEGGLSTEKAIVADVERQAGLRDDESIYVMNEPWFLLASGRDHIAPPYYYLWSGVEDLIREREGINATLVRPLLDEQPKLVVLGFPAVWLHPGDRSDIQQSYAGALLFNYERLPTSGLRGSFVTRAANYWVLREEGEQVDPSAQLRAAASIPWLIGGWAASDLRPLLGNPALLQRPPSSRLTDALVWTLDGSGATEIVGDVGAVIPDDIDPNDGTLDFDVVVALSVDGSDGDHVTLQIQVDTASSDSPEDGGARQIATATLDVSTARSGQVFLISLSPEFVFAPGEGMMLSIRRLSGDPRDTYPHDLHLFGLTAAYRPVLR